MNELRQEILACELCALRKGCRRPVPGRGPTNAEVMLIGEAHGKNEDIRGVPWIGKAGKELDHYLKFYTRILREDIYVTNTVKCRPQGNRNPRGDEMEACSVWLQRELDLVRPSIVILAGDIAGRAWFGDDFSIEREHGIPRSGDVRRGRGCDAIIIPVLHPAAGLHESRTMSMIQQDFQAVGEVIRGVYQGVKDEHPETDYRLAR